MRSLSPSLPLAVYILSADKLDRPREENARNAKALRDAIRRAGYPCRVARGHSAQWGDESSICLFVSPNGAKDARGLVLALLARFQQEAAVYVSPRRVASLLLTADGSVSRLGTWRATHRRPSGDYTFVPCVKTFYYVEA